MTEGRPEPPPKLVLDFVHASLPKPKRYELTVLGPTSQPVAGATVVRTSGLVRTTTQTDERGQFVIEVGWNETVNPPSIVKDDLFWPAIELWRRVNNGWLEYAAQHPIVLRPKSTVALPVIDPDGQPIEGVALNPMSDFATASWPSPRTIQWSGGRPRRRSGQRRT